MDKSCRHRGNSNNSAGTICTRENMFNMKNKKKKHTHTQLFHFIPFFVYIGSVTCSKMGNKSCKRSKATRRTGVCVYYLVHLFIIYLFIFSFSNKYKYLKMKEITIYVLMLYNHLFFSFSFFKYKLSF